MEKDDNNPSSMVGRLDLREQVLSSRLGGPTGPIVLNYLREIRSRKSGGGSKLETIPGEQFQGKDGELVPDVNPVHVQEQKGLVEPLLPKWCFRKSGGKPDHLRVLRAMGTGMSKKDAKTHAAHIMLYKLLQCPKATPAEVTDIQDRLTRCSKEPCGKEASAIAMLQEHAQKFSRYLPLYRDEEKSGDLFCTVCEFPEDHF